jgi:hypothetical protein
MNDQKPSGQGIRKFLLNMLPTFLGVVLAFLLTEWASQRDFQAKERHLLTEVQHELEVNLSDLNINLLGHRQAIKSIDKIRGLMKDEKASLDSLNFDLMFALRDFTSIQHTAAYETMKTRGTESVGNDSLRMRISDLYDFDFESIEKIEERYAPHEFFVHYNEPVLQAFAKCYDFTAAQEQNKRIMPLTALPKNELNLLTARFRKLKFDRMMCVKMYEDVAKKTEQLIADIKKELGT